MVVDLNPEQLFAKSLSAADVSAALGNQNLILPAGTAKIGDKDYQVKLNSSPRILDEMNNLPVKVVNGATVYLKDVAQVHDGYSVQTSIVRTNGSRGALLTVLRNGKASTLAVVDKVKTGAAQDPGRTALQPCRCGSCSINRCSCGRPSAASSGRPIIAAFLTGMMILLFLGSWRSTVIVCISIPLSILVSLIVLNLMGETINVMTLGGMALAVGILVDDATVEIENTHRNMAMRKPLVRAVLDGAQQIAAPAFVSTLSICIVFVPVLLLTGAAKYLFTPLAMAVVFAMMASYFLSRTLIPTMVHYMLRAEVKLYARGQHGESEGRQRALLAYALPVQPALRADAGLLHVAAALVPGPSRSGAGGLRHLRDRVAGAHAARSGATSSRRWIPARCGCMRVRPRAPGSRRPSRFSPPSKTRSAR